MDIKLLEGILISVLALGIGFWQLYDVNKELKKTEAEERRAEAEARDRSTNDQTN